MLSIIALMDTMVVRRRHGGASAAGVVGWDDYHPTTSPHTGSRSRSCQRCGTPAPQARPSFEQPLWPSLVFEMASVLFSESIFQKPVLHRQLGVHLREPAILVRHRLHLRHQRAVHAVILAAPVVVGRVTDAVLAAKITHRHAAFALFQDRQDLRLGKFRFLLKETMTTSLVKRRL